MNLRGLFLSVLSRVRCGWLRWRGVRFQGKAWVQAIEIPRHPEDISLGDGVALDRGVTLLATREGGAPARISIGARTYINRHTILDATQEISIGQDCMIGPFCYITDHDHTQGEDGRPGSGTLLCRPTHLEDRCWIGAHVTILKGVHIGAGAIIGAGSVVTRPIPAGATALGNPARVLSKTTLPENEKRA
jgi:serine acetyltransferase